MRRLQISNAPRLTRIGRRYALHVLLFTTSAFLLPACSREEAPPPALKSPVGAVAEEEQRPGNPEAGYKALINEPYVTCGIPYMAYKQIADPPSSDQLLPHRSGRNAELPYMLTSHVTEAGVELVTSNCLTCHAAFFNGELIVGLGNESMDWTNDPTGFAERVGAYVAGEAEAVEWRKWADRIAAIAPYVVTDTVGVNSANNLTLALFAHRDPRSLAWSDEPVIEPPPTRPLPVSVPPWWRMKKKHAMFYHTGGRGDHARFMMTASSLCTDSVEEARAIDAYFTDVRAFIYSIEPPSYPMGIDRDLARRGQAVFEEHCSRCHGTYGDDWTYPNLVVALEEIGTDPELARSAVENQDRFIRWFNTSFYGEHARAAPAPGYIAPPLDGVWATAPYLHNGSVPSIAALLKSSTRPKYWVRSFDDSDYDPAALGWRYTELDHGKAGAADAEDRKRIYDTTRPGYSNQGHAFGDPLSDAARAAVLEYMKTL